MNVSGMLAELNQEIARLTQIRDLLEQKAPSKPGPGRPKGSGKQADSEVSEPAPKRTMSAEGREKIAAAQRKRWAAGKKASTSMPAALPAKSPAAKPAAKKAVSAKKAAPKPPPAKKAAGKGIPPNKAAKHVPTKAQQNTEAPAEI